MDDHGHVARTAEVIAAKWTPQLLDALSAGPARFCDLERAIPGIAPRTLTMRLRSLESAGIVQRGSERRTPPAAAADESCSPGAASAQYCLTTMGEALLPIVAAMRSFGREWQPAKPLRVVA